MSLTNELLNYLPRSLVHFILLPYLSNLEDYKELINELNYKFTHFVGDTPCYCKLCLSFFFKEALLFNSYTKNSYYIDNFLYICPNPLYSNNPITKWTYNKLINFGYNHFRPYNKFLYH